MAHHGIVSCRQNGAQHMSLSPQLSVAERVDTAVDTQQPPGAQAVVYGILAQPKGQQLSPRNQPVLSSG